MSCANGGITLFSLIILVLTIWPTLIGSAGKWIIIIAAILSIIFALTGCNCKWCENTPKKKR